MPSIIDYSFVLQQLESDGLRCNYFNSGSFGFAADTTTWIRGWVGPPDDTIRPGMKHTIRTVPEPYEENLAKAAVRAWRELLPGNAWVMPASHWSFELEHGNRHWLPGLLEAIGIDSNGLSSRTNAAAVEFQAGDERLFEQISAGLLHALTGSD